MRRLHVALVVMFVVAGCGGTAGPVASAPTSGPTVAASPGTPPSAAVPPSQTATPCPTASPMSVATYLAADPTCFGSADVMLQGWEDMPNGSIAGPETAWLRPDWIGQDPPAVLVDHLPRGCTLDVGCEPVLQVHVDPASGLQFERDGRYVRITGHRGDPAAAACTYDIPAELGGPIPSVGAAQAVCAEAFVLRSVTPIEPPPSSLDFCDVPGTLTVHEFQTIDPVCVAGRSFQILGYVDDIPAIDFGGPTISPSWMVDAAGPGVLWSVVPRHDAGNGICPDVVVVCDWMFLRLEPGSGVAIPYRHWVIATGHLDDPVAESCRYTNGGPYGGPIPPPITARQDCRSSFIVTRVERTAAPSG